MGEHQAQPNNRGDPETGRSSIALSPQECIRSAGTGTHHEDHPRRVRSKEMRQRNRGILDLRLYTGRNITVMYIITPPPLIHAAPDPSLQTTVHVVADGILEESAL
jgi:hypothetical protein